MKLLTVAELADLMNVSPGHIRNLMSNKKITFYRIQGIGIRFLASDVLSWIDAGRQEAEDWNERAREILDKSYGKQKGR